MAAQDGEQRFRDAVRVGGHHHLHAGIGHGGERHADVGAVHGDHLLEGARIVQDAQVLTGSGIGHIVEVDHHGFRGR
jgi:hypothetical protein